MALDKQISANSIYSSRHPQMFSRYGANVTDGLVIDKEKVLYLYVDNWGGAKSKIPKGFIDGSSKALADLIDDEGIASSKNRYVQFLMQSVNMGFNETVVPQKNVTRGFTTFTFGQEPPVFSFSGTLVHTFHDNWSETFLALYHYFLRAPRLAELTLLNDKRDKPYQIVIRYQDKIMKGSIISLSQTDQANNEQMVPFQFQFLCKELTFAWNGKATITPTPTKDVSATRYTATSQGKTIERKINKVPQGTNTADNSPAVTKKAAEALVGPTVESATRLLSELERQAALLAAQAALAEQGSNVTDGLISGGN